MTAYKNWMIMLIILMLSLMAIAIWTIQERFFKQDLLTIQEATEKIEDLYGGSIESFEQKGNVFYMQLERKGLAYDIQVDGNSGDLITITKIKNEVKNTSTIKTIEEIRSLIMSQNKGEIVSIALQENREKPQYVVDASYNETRKTIIVDAKTGKIISEQIKETTSPPPAPTIISKERASQIALSQLSGNVISITFHETNEGGYYLVKVIGSNMDATFEIHAISGKVLSVTQHRQPAVEKSSNTNKTPQKTEDDDDDDNDDDDNDESEEDDSDESEEDDSDNSDDEDDDD